jgi:hypothetical protein
MALPGGMAPADTPIADDPANPSQSRVHWTSEELMGFDIHPEDMIPAGVFSVRITNPDGSHAVTIDQGLAVLPPPLVTQLVPPAICDDQSDQTIEIDGANFLRFDDKTPTVTVDTKTYTATVVEASCMPVVGNFVEQNVWLCSAITIPQGDFDVTTTTTVPVTVTNPPPADCASSEQVNLTIDPPPRVDSVIPSTSAPVRSSRAGTRA